MIILVGIPGCGKSSILAAAKKKCPDLDIVNYGDKMLEIASLHKSERDQLRKMPAEEQKKIGLLAAEKIAAEAKKVTLVDTHALIRTPFGYCPGLPKSVLEVLEPKVCAIVECAPELIAQRRAQDTSRERDVELEEELTRHQELARTYLAACVLQTGALLCCIQNTSPKLEENARPLIEVVEFLQKKGN